VIYLYRYVAEKQGYKRLSWWKSLRVRLFGISCGGIYVYGHDTYYEGPVWEYDPW